MKKTQKSLIFSLISLVLCFSMLVGTTFAWFTDSVSSANNIISAGNLDVKMYWSNDMTNWNDIEGENNKVFNYDNWEPGYTEVKYLKIQNNGSLAFKYSLNLLALGEVGLLAEVIDVYYGEAPAQPLADRDLSSLTKRDGTLKELIGGSSALMEGVLLPANKTDANYKSGEVIIALALHMQESAGNKYQNQSVGDGFTVQVVATQFDYEADGFGGGYDQNAQWPNNNTVTNGNASADVTVGADNKTTAEITMISADGKYSATIPAGVSVDGNKLTLSVTEVENSQANITLDENENTLSVDVHIDGVAEDNDTVMSIAIKELLPVGLNMGNYRFYHVEDGNTVEMTLLADGATPVHNNYEYDPATGDVVLYLASFSEVALVAEPAKWEGEYDYSWYDASKTEFLIANSDQLAGFGAIVGGMNGKTADDFAGKTVKLVADIVIGDLTDEDGRAVMFYPIGYYNTTESYVKTAGVEVTSGFRNFAGTFDGNGHTVSDWYQNTWEAFGDYNDGYSGTPNHYRDGFGLFGRVYKGTVKNLTVKNFSSDGEFTTTGTIAAYAEGATFENIAIFNCNPRVYNIGNGGIVGCVGWYATEEGLKTTFKNITVDNTNKISALWGSWDVACGGIVGQYYPTSGQTSANKPANGGVHFENCHVAAQIDVYNDVCANYQYYAYRYAGILMGSVRENVTINGHEYPKMDGITASGCTVHFGDWNDYYYCELVANTLASYTHDHQMSRLTQVEKLDANEKKYLPLGAEDKAENWVAIPESGRQNYVVVNGKTADGKWDHGDGKATCYHFVNGVQHKHDVADSDNPNVYETVDGVEVLKEDKQCIYREFNNLITGYGWGVTSKGVADMDGVTILDREEGTSVEKFTGNGVAEIESNTAIKLSDLFNFVNNGVELKLDGLNVTITDLDETDGIATGTFTKGTTWEESTITINGKGRIAITIQDYYFCEPTTIELTVIDPVQSITIEAQTLYEVGAELIINKVTANYKSGATEVIGTYTLSAYDMSFAGKKTIALTYTEYDHTYTQTFVITVADDFNSIIVTPDKDIYDIGDKVNFTVYAVAANGTRSKVEDATITGADTSTAGIKTVTVTYGNKSTTCEINVVNKTKLVGDTPTMYYYYNHQFKLGGVASSSSHNYNDYVGKTFTGSNGELATGFNNDFGYSYETADGKTAQRMGEKQYDLTVTNALPYTYIGIHCIAGFDEQILGFGYYVDGDVNTLDYSAPLYYSELVKNDSGYQQFLDLGGEHTAEANVNVSLEELGFEAGSMHTVTWVVVFEDGIKEISDWTIIMKSSFGTNEYFKDTEKTNVNVIVLSGQSNAAGVAPVTPEMQVKYSNVNYKNVFMQYKTVGFDGNGVKYTWNENNAFETYSYGMGGAYEGYFGPDAALAYYLATTEGLKDEQWFIIKYTAPGTGLELHWLNNNNLAAEMMNYVEDCIGDLTEQYDVQIRSLLWMQGENDALVEDIAGRYAMNERSFVTMFRNRFAEYSTLPNAQIPGSGISFISAGIAPAGKDGNTWTYANAVNAAKRDNAYIWYAPGSIGEDSILFEYSDLFEDNKVGGKSGSIINPNATYGIYNSVYIDTSLMSAKADDNAHYDTQSMEWLGTWFAQYVESMMTAELPAPPASSDSYTIYLDPTGGKLDKIVLDVKNGASVALPTPTRDGYYFMGWVDLSGKMVDMNYKPTESMMLSAKWGNRIITIQNNIEGVTIEGVTNNQIVNAGDIVTVTVKNNSARPVAFYLYDSTNNVLLWPEAVASGGTSTLVPWDMSTNIKVVISADAYAVDLQNHVGDGVAVTGVPGATFVGQELSSVFTNNSGKTVYIVYHNSTAGTDIAKFELKNGESLPVGYPMTNDLLITISYGGYTVKTSGNVSSIRTSFDKSSAAAGETVTITFRNTSWSSVTVYYTIAGEKKSVTVDAFSSKTVTFVMPAENVTVTISDK